MIVISSLNNLSVYLQKLVKGKLWLKVIIGLLAGILVGILIHPDSGLISKHLGSSIGNWLDLPGQIFMRLVQMIMIPLIFASIISGIVSNVSDNLKSFGVSLLLYFIFTTFIAISLGVLVSVWLNPGLYVSELNAFSLGESLQSTGTTEASATFNDIPNRISNLIPSNPLESILSGEMLSIVVFTIIIGVAITQLEDKMARPIVRLVEAIQKICMVVVGWAMLLVPFAVFGLMAALISRTGSEVLLGLAYYMLVVIAGLALLMITYLLLIFFVAKRNPFRFLRAIRDPQLLAFSTASSAAVMPLSMKVADEKLHVSSSISDFVIPIGATVNMDGTALFQCVTVLFLAQAYHIDLALMDVVLITFTVVAASIGTPAIPGGGVIVLASVLQSSGIPSEGLLIIIGIDRILGMFRTAVNVTGDLTASVIFNRWFGTGTNKPITYQ